MRGVEQGAGEGAVQVVAGFRNRRPETLPPHPPTHTR